MNINVTVSDKIAKETIEDVFMNIDIARYIGYWARLEDCEDNGNLVFTDLETDKRFTITEDFAVKCFHKLVGSVGLNNFDNCDGSDYDEAVQRALYNEVVYG